MSDAKVTGYTFYRARYGDTFDLLAAQMYGDEGLCHHIIQANPRHMRTLVFRGGEVVRMPVLEKIETTESQPPWRR